MIEYSEQIIVKNNGTENGSKSEESREILDIKYNESIINETLRPIESELNDQKYSNNAVDQLTQLTVHQINRPSIEDNFSSTNYNQKSNNQSKGYNIEMNSIKPQTNSAYNKSLISIPPVINSKNIEF